MKKAIFIAATIALMGCTSKAGSDTTATDTTQVATEQAQAVDLSTLSEEQITEMANKRITEIYNEVFAWYNAPENGTKQAPDFEAKYMSSGYNKLIQQVRAIDDELAQKGEIGFFDYDHWVWGQDYGDLSMEIKSGKWQGNGHYSAEIVINNLGTANVVGLDMLYEAGQWVINDFMEPAPESKTVTTSSEVARMETFVHSNEAK